MKNLLYTSFLVFSLTCTFLQASGQQYTLSSPGNKLKIVVNVDTVVRYEVYYNDVSLIEPSPISISFNNGIAAGINGVVASSEERSVSDVITRPFGKSKELEDNYNELILDFSQNYSLIFRAYDEGMGYRFVTEFGESVVVNEELATFNFAFAPSVIFPEADPAMQSWERAYTTYNSMADIPGNKFSITPTMFTNNQNNLRVWDRKR